MTACLIFGAGPSQSVGSERWQTEAMEPRFLLMADVAEQLNVSTSQVYHMVRSGELPAIKVGGRGQWRIERTKLEEYIERQVRRDRRVGPHQPAGRPRRTTSSAA